MIDQCFASVGTVMRPSSVFFFTFKEETEYRRRAEQKFRYPGSFFAGLAEHYGFRFERHNDYHHPRGQQMASIHRSASPFTRH